MDVFTTTLVCCLLFGTRNKMLWLFDILKKENIDIRYLQKLD